MEQRCHKMGQMAPRVPSDDPFEPIHTGRAFGVVVADAAGRDDDRCARDGSVALGMDAGGRPAVRRLV